MSATLTLATTARVLAQLRRDPRTIGLLLLVPTLLVVLVKYLFAENEAIFDRVGGPMLGIFPFITMFVVTSITMLRERVTGTLERLMTMPIAKLDLLLGYGIAFAAVAALQATLVSLVAVGLLDLDVQTSVAVVVALAIANAVLGMALGLFASAFARTEFQAVQFIPAFVLPQILLCGLLVPPENMARVLEWTSYALPLSYSFDALARATQTGTFDDRFTLDVTITVGAALVALALAAATLRRRTP